ncbi:MAG: flagellar biosynthesis protein FlhB [Thermodesulfobacteriota bacterium]|nr:flagellar biosynthesis protein FlhB [Thermodesulfobacteriota bacterium]
MPEGSDNEKTEQATPKRREEAKKKGQTAQSKEVPTVVVLLSCIGTLFFSGSWIFWNLSVLMRGMFQNICTLHLRDDTVYALLLETFGRIAMIVVPFMLIIFVAGIAANLLQIGFIFSAEPLIPKLSKINPVNGVKKLLSLRSLIELFKSLFKVLIVGGMAYLIVRSELKVIPCLVHMNARDILSFIAGSSFNICLYTCLALGLLAAVDYAFQKWQHEKDLKMTKQEVKDETKQREGDPAVKARIRSIQREMSQRRMMEMVPEADVVITNPVSLSIALKYDPSEMIAPRIIAKGAGFIAERIKVIAYENGIAIVENKPLAQTLFKAVEIGDFIPIDLYQAIAEILAYVYRLKGARSQT